MPIELEKIPKNQIVTLYSEDIDEEFVNGFIVAWDEEEFIMACLDIYGEYNGFLLLRAYGIYRVDYDSEYENKITQLYQIKKQSYPIINNMDTSESLMDSLLAWAMYNGKVIKLKFDSKEICGFLCNMDQWRIRVIDQYECKPDQGYALVDPVSADAIWVDEKRIRDAGMVYEYRRIKHDV